MNRKLVTVIAAASTLLLFAGACSASDNLAVVSFAKANAGKFKSEIVETKGLGVGSRVVVKGRLNDYPFHEPADKYDDSTGEMITSQFTHLRPIIVSASCKSNGVYQGQNAFGAKAAVKKVACEYVEFDDTGGIGIPFSNTRIKMTPAQFRKIMKSGSEVELVLTIAVKDQYASLLDNQINSATLSNPIETRSKVWTIYGNIEALRFVLPDSKELVTVIERQ